MKKNILITGINGFIARNIYKKLLVDYEIFGLSKENKSDFCDNYLSLNLGEEGFIENAKKSLPDIDIIIHTAACIFGDENSLISTNCKGVIQISSLAKLLNAKKIIYFSSLPIIGKPEIIPITEEHSVKPRTLYHTTKLFGENVLNCLTSEGINVINLRLTSPIGFDMPDNKIFSIFVEKCLKNENIILYGKGSRIQNYIDINDIVRAVELAIQYKDSNTFNIASDKSYSNLELAKICIDETNSKSRIEFSNEVDKEEDFKWIVDTNKAKTLLGFKPKVDIRQSIRNRRSFYESSNLF